MKARLSNQILLSLGLSLPIVLFYFLHFIFGAELGQRPTGFIQSDMPYYMAHARQYIDGQHNGLAYSNPYDFKDNSPKIYFQPHIYAFGLLLKLEFIDPGFAFAAFGILCTIIAFFILQRLIDAYCPVRGLLRVFLLCMVAWGGGCLVLLSLTAALVNGEALRFFTYDPFDGWWFLNLGRNFVYPTEAFYHVIVLLLFFSVLKQKTILALILTWLLALSHPFTGMQYSLIIFFWSAFECFFMKSERFKRATVVLFAAPVLFCFCYYLLFLPSFPSHRNLMEQISLNWSMKLPTIFGAYSLVGFLAWTQCRNKDAFIECFKNPFNRFLAISAAISFAIANHEFLIEPIQPLHFTRGHIWTPLCLLALPVIRDVWRQFMNRRKLITLVVIASCFGSLMLSDNLTWFLSNYLRPHYGIFLYDDEVELMHFLKSQPENSVILLDNGKFSYLTATYTSARPYVGHWYNTPEIDRKRQAVKDFFFNRVEPEDLRNTNYRVITAKFKNVMSKDERFKEIFSKNGVSVFERVLSRQ